MPRTRFTMGAVLASALAIGMPSAVSAQTPIDVGASAPRDVVVFLRLQSGSVRLTGWDRDSMHVSGRLAPGESWVTRLTGDTLRLRAEGMPRGLSAPSELEIFVPRTSPLIVRAAAASLVVRDFDRSVDVGTAAGNLLVEAVLGDVRAETMQGTLAVIGPVPRVDASTASGALLVSVPYDTITDGDVSRVVRRPDGPRHFGVMTVRSVSGEITVNAPQVDSALVQNVRGDTRVVGAPSPDGVLRVTSHAGRITLGVAELADGATAPLVRTATVQLDALTQKGGLRGAMAVDPERTPAGVRLRQWLDGRPAPAAGVGPGSGSLLIRNVRGDIVFEQVARPAP